MINSIHLQNWQSYADTSLTFKYGLNVIVGSSGAGKSAIFRGLRWVTWNKPSGDDLRSDWGGNSRVTVNFTDCTVARHKGNDGNYYLLNGAKFGGLKRSETPSEIQQAINLAPVNVEFQLQSHFLLSSTSGAVAQYFNRIAKLDVIDEAVRILNRKMNATKRTIDDEEANVKRLSAELDNYTYLEDAEAEIEVLEQTDADIDSITTQIEWLTSATEEAEQLQQEVTNQQHIAKALPLIEEALEQWQHEHEQDRQARELEDLCNGYTQWQEDLEYWQRIANATSIIDEALTNLHSEQDTQQQLEELTGYIRAAEDLQKTVQDKQQEVTYYIEQYNTHATGQTCPLCEGAGTIEKIE